MEIDDDILERAISIFERNDGYDTCRKLERTFEDASEAEIGELIWEVFHTGEIEFSEVQYPHKMADAPEAYDADDVIAVIEEYAGHYGADGSMPTDYGSTWLWNDGELPGYFGGMYDLLESKSDDEAFLEAVAEKREALLSPYDDAVAYALAQLGRLDAEDLPEGLLETAAETYVHNDHMHTPNWLEPRVWTDDVWGEAILEAARQPDATIPTPSVFEALTEYADASEIVECASRAHYEMDVWTNVEAVTSYGADVIEPLEEALRDLEGTIDRAASSEPWPVFILGMAYLELCDAHDHTPSPDLDGVFEGFADHYEPASYSGMEPSPRWRVLEALSVIPDERLESILLAPDDLNWWLVGAASSSAEVLNRVVEELTSDPDLGWNQSKALKPGLVSLGTDGLDAFRELLAGDDFEHRQTVIEAAAAIEEDEAAPVLALALEDRRKTYREPARKGLLELSEEAVLDVIDEPLHGSRKHMRLAAAKVLGQLPKSERRYELAQDRLEEERTQDVQDVLEQIEPPDTEKDGSDLDPEAAFEMLDEDDLSGWSEVAEETGVETIRLVVDFLDEEIMGWSHQEQEETFLEIVEHFDDEPETVGYAVAAIPDAERRAKSLLKRLHERLDGVLEEVHRQLLDTVELEKNYWFDEQDVVEWIAEEVPEEGKDVLRKLLGDRRKTIRRPAIKGLVSLGESVAEEVWQFLLDDDTKADGREAAAQTLAKIGTPDAVPHLEEAKEGERSGRVEEAIEEALVACRNASLDVTDIEEDAALDEALAELDLARPDPFPDDLPTLHWADSGEALSEGATDWVLAQLLREDQETHNEQLLEVRERLDDADCHELCDALLEAAPYTDRGWGLYIQPVIGSDDHIDALGEKLEDLASSASTNWGTDGVEVMVRHGSDTAVQWLDHSVRKTSRDALRGRARDGLQRLADTRDMSVDDLVLKTTPDFGFDRSGEQRVDYGSRDIIVRLDPENGLEFEDDKGKVRDWFPTPRKADDDEKVEAAKDQFRGMKRRIKQITQGLRERFEEAMVTGRTWPLQEWQQLFVDHPIAFSLTRRLVFEARGEGDDAPIRFAVSREGTFLDAEGLPVELPEAGEVGLVHPIELADDEREAWRDHLEMRDVHPPFPQMDRDLYPTDELPDDEQALLLEFPQVHPGAFMGRLNDRGYERGPRLDAGMIFESYKSLGPYQIELSHDGYSPEAIDAVGDIEIDGISIRRRHDSDESVSHMSNDPNLLGIEELPERFSSEIVRDLKVLTEVG